MHPKVDVKLFLWGLFLLQIFLISVFLAFGSLLASNIHQDELSGTSSQALVGTEPSKTSWFNVKFISDSQQPKKADEELSLVAATVKPGPGSRMRHPWFKPLQQKAIPKPDSYTKYYRWIYYHDGYREHRRLCFIEGTHFPAVKAPPKPTTTTTTNETDVEAGEAGAGNELVVGRTRMEESEDENEVYPDGRCRCKPEWHGPDCGQPEVLWRAFIASRIPPRNQTAAPRKVPKAVFYVIDTTFISVEVLEMQMMELVDVVSLFVLCDRQLEAVGGMKKDAYSIGDHLGSTDFLKLNRERILLVEDVTCSGRNVFRKMRKFINKSDMHGEDLLLYSRTDEILNRRAVNYFRWYDNWPQPVRFRLKYNVFGFFWQHPASTLIGGAACQLSTVDEVYRSDPERLLRIDKPVMLIGDLNHYGGWYCRHCYQPIDIVKYLEFIALVNTTSTGTSPDSNSGTAQQSSYLPDPKKATVMDAEYVQNLIASGKYFGDETLTLTKLQRHVDKYYAPEYVRKNSWRFDNVVINLFARWEDSVIDDEYFS